MKVSLIPPVPELSRTVDGEIQCHLLLSHLIRYPGYTEFFLERRARGDYLILDNSAHEFKEGQDISILIDQSRSLGAQEIVCPDVLFDWEGTVDNCRVSLEKLRQVDWSDTPHPSVMLVPQGIHPSDWESCLDELMYLYYDYLTWLPRETITKSLTGLSPVIGLSKDYEAWNGGLVTLLQTHILSLCQSDPNIQVHCLGWGRDLWEIREIARECPWVRSIDSAKPFVYGLAGVDLTQCHQAPKYPRRPRDYFSKVLTADELTLSLKNARVFRALAEGRDDWRTV